MIIFSFLFGGIFLFFYSKLVSSVERKAIDFNMWAKSVPNCPRD